MPWTEGKAMKRGPGLAVRLLGVPAGGFRSFPGMRGWSREGGVGDVLCWGGDVDGSARREVGVG